VICRLPRRLFHVAVLPKITVVFALVSFSNGSSVQHDLRHGIVAPFFPSYREKAAVSVDLSRHPMIPTRKGRIFRECKMSELSKDLLRGVRAIAEEIGETERITNDHLARGLIPGAKFGKTWISSRTKLAKYYSDRIDQSIKETRAR
jgi:hypothetical protein